MEGWGGPPKGPGNHGPGPGRPPGVKDGEGKRARARAKLEEAASDAIDTVISLSKDITDQRALAAALAILNRIGLHEKSGIEHTGEDGGPVATSLTVRFVDPGGN